MKNIFQKETRASLSIWWIISGICFFFTSSALEAQAILCEIQYNATDLLAGRDVQCPIYSRPSVEGDPTIEMDGRDLLTVSYSITWEGYSALKCSDDTYDPSRLGFSLVPLAYWDDSGRDGWGSIKLWDCYDNKYVQESQTGGIVPGTTFIQQWYVNSDSSAYLPKGEGDSYAKSTDGLIGSFVIDSANFQLEPHKAFSMLVTVYCPVNDATYRTVGSIDYMPWGYVLNGQLRDGTPTVCSRSPHLIFGDSSEPNKGYTVSSSGSFDIMGECYNTDGNPIKLTVSGGATVMPSEVLCSTDTTMEWSATIFPLPGRRNITISGRVTNNEGLEGWFDSVNINIDPWPTLTFDKPKVGEGTTVRPISSSNPFIVGGTCSNTDDKPIYLYCGISQMADCVPENKTSCIDGKWSANIDPSNIVSPGKSLFNIIGFTSNIKDFEITVTTQIKVILGLTLDVPAQDPQDSNIRPVKLGKPTQPPVVTYPLIPISGSCTAYGDSIELKAEYYDKSISDDILSMDNAITPTSITCRTDFTWSAKVDPSLVLPSNQRIIYLNGEEKQNGAVISSFSSQQQIQLPPPDLVVGYVNGILNTQTDAKNSTGDLYSMVTNYAPMEPLLKGVAVSPASFWNPEVWSKPFSILSKAKNQSIVMGACVAAEANRSVIILVEQGNTTAIQECGLDPAYILAQGTDLRIVANVAQRLSTQANNTILVDINKRLLLVGHSQGTGYANQIYYGLSAKHQRHVSVVHIASIATEMAGDPTYSRWTTAQDDKVINELRVAVAAEPAGALVLPARPGNLALDRICQEMNDPEERVNAGCDSHLNHYLKYYLQDDQARTEILKNIQAAVTQIMQ